MLAQVVLLALLVAACGAAGAAQPAHSGSVATWPLLADGDSLNQLVVSYSAWPDPFHWFSFYSLPRTESDARRQGWAPANATLAGPMASLGADGKVSTWCRKADYRVCLLFDAAGVVAGLQVSVSVRDFEQSFGSKRYPIALETQWQRHTLLDTEVYSASALFESPVRLNEGGRVDFKEGDNTVEDTLYLENGNSFWAMPRIAQQASDVDYTKQGCVKGMGRHYFYNMSPNMTCEEHRPFFLLFDDVTGVLNGFGVTLFGKSSHDGWFSRQWLESPGRKMVEKMAPQGPRCLSEWTKHGGMVALHVYFKGKPWKAECAKH